MKRLSTAVLVAMCTLFLTGAMPAQGKEGSDGKAIFTGNKCTTCHGVEAAGIVKKSKGGPPDLSRVGVKANADRLGKFLRKTEAIKGVKHPVQFKGTETDLATLTQWLVALKGEERTGKK